MKSNRFFALLLALAMLLSMSALAESVTLTDMTGHEITIDEPVTRIVVLQPSEALQQARTMAALCASSHPQGRRFPVHRQVSRLGFLRRNTFPAYFSPVAAPNFLGTRSLVCFTVAGTAPVLHRLPMFAEHARVRRRASLRTCVGCSFVTDIIHADGALVNLLRFLDTFPAICYNSDGRNRTCGFHPFSLHIISHTRCDFPCARGVSPCNKSHQQT